jgi:hypothetical protein
VGVKTLAQIERLYEDLVAEVAEVAQTRSEQG